jgi:hypothetical protein
LSWESGLISSEQSRDGVGADAGGLVPRHPWTPHRRTTRAISAARILEASRRVVPNRSGSVIAKTGDFAVEFDEGDGLKNRCRLKKKKLDLVNADFTYT